MTREEYVAALRQVADFYEQHPEVPFQEQYTDGYQETVWVSSEKLLELPRILGSFDKVADGQYFTLRKHLGPNVTIDFFSAREAVCTKVVRGVEKVVEKVPTAWEEREVEKEIVEWECPPILGRNVKDAVVGSETP